jgi:hypothetical protein
MNPEVRKWLLGIVRLTVAVALVLLLLWLVWS